MRIPTCIVDANLHCDFVKFFPWATWCGRQNKFVLSMIKIICISYFTIIGSERNIGWIRMMRYCILRCSSEVPLSVVNIISIRFESFGMPHAL